VANLGPRETLLNALAAYGPTDAANPPLAVDVGCGEGRDTRELLSRGWRVTAFDATPLAIERLIARTGEQERGRLDARVLGFEDVATDSILPRAAQLINASFALPFCHPDAFPALWAWIVKTIVRGGLFAGQIFGDRDEWASIRPGSHYSRDQTLALLAPFDLLHFEEVDKEGGDALGITKHHHLFHVVARKR